TRIKTKAKVAKSDKKKQPAKKLKAKELAVLSKVALTEAEQLKLATKRSKNDYHISHASGLGDGVDTQSKVPDEQRQKTSGTDSDEEDDFEDDANNNDDDSDDNGGSEYHDDDSDDERTKSDRDEISDPNLTILDQTKHEEEIIDERVHTPSDYELTDDEKIYDEENIDKEEEDEVTKKLYDDVNVNMGNEDTKMTNRSNTKLLNLDNPSPADNEIASLMDTTTYHAIAILEITSSFKTPTPPPPPFFNPLSVTNLEKDLSEVKQVDQYAQAFSFIPVIVNGYMDNKLGEAINKAIQAHNSDCSEEAQAEKRKYIGLFDLSVRTIIKEEVNAQLPQILPQLISDVATPVIKKNVTESLEAAVLTRSLSQP
nr:hypothetical protein [Tanacetum cinerariifolium]